MSYTPNTWATGDTITANKLNNMEQGIANAGGGYDVIVTTENIGGTTAANYTKVKFDVDDVREKIQSGTPVTGALLYLYNYDEEVDGYTDSNLIPLEHIAVYHNECLLYFNKIIARSYNTTNASLLVWYCRTVLICDLNGNITGVNDAFEDSKSIT